MRIHVDIILDDRTPYEQAAEDWRKEHLGETVTLCDGDDDIIAQGSITRIILPMDDNVQG